MHLVQRRHPNIHMPPSDELLHVTEEESEQNGADVRAVLIGIGEDDDFVVFEVGEVEILVDGRAERGNQRAELLIAQHLIQPLLFGIEGLAAQGENRLIAAVAPLLGAAACGIALDDEQLIVLRLLPRQALSLPTSGAASS